MIPHKVTSVICGTVLLLFSLSPAALITFDDVLSGETVYTVDADNDGVDDVIFSTADPNGLNIIDPGFPTTNLDLPGLQGDAHVDDPGDLRVDFLSGAQDNLAFGFAISANDESEDLWAQFDVYDESDLLLASSTVPGQFTGFSSFPEGRIETAFSGTASYAVFNFNAPDTPFFDELFLIDNFEGTFASSEVGSPPDPHSVPEPGVSILLLSGLIGVAGVSFMKRK